MAGAKKKGFFPAALTNLARDAAIASAVEKGLEKGIKEITKNKELRRAGTDMIVNYARSHSNTNNTSSSKKNKHKQRAYDDSDDDDDDDHDNSDDNNDANHRRRRRHSTAYAPPAAAKNRRQYYDDDDRFDDRQQGPARSASTGSRKGKERAMYNMRNDPYEDPHGLSRSRTISHAYGDVPDRPPPQPTTGSYYHSAPQHHHHQQRERKSSFGDGWLERAFGAAPTWQRGSGFRVIDDYQQRPGLARSISNPGQPRSAMRGGSAAGAGAGAGGGSGGDDGGNGFSYSRGGHGYAFANMPAPSAPRGTSIDGGRPNHASPYDPDFRSRQAQRREEEDYHRQLLARQAELGGVAMSSSGVPLYGYRPGEEPSSSHAASPAQVQKQQQQQQSAKSQGGGGRNVFARFFSPFSPSSPAAHSPGGSASRTPIETRLGTYNASGSGLYSQTFTPAPSPPIAPPTPPAKELPDTVTVTAAAAALQTRQSVAPELRSKTRPHDGSAPPASGAGAGAAVLTSAPAVIASADPSHALRFPLPRITRETSIQTLAFAARCSQIIYHLSTSSAVRHYQRNYDSHAANPSLLEAHFADPARGTKNWALLRRKADGAMVVAVRGSGRGLSRGTDYSSDLSWLDDEEWLSDMMLNLRARKWGGGGGGGGGTVGAGKGSSGGGAAGGGSLAKSATAIAAANPELGRRNSTGSAGASRAGGGSGHRRSSSSAASSLHLSSIRCADGSAFEAHEGFLRCAMAMYADVRHALDKKLKMWMVLAASSGIQIGIGGRGGPGTGGEDGEGGSAAAAAAAAAAATAAHKELVSPPELILTGHSAGGAVASLLYVLLNSASRDLLDRFGKVSVITFGAAAAFPHPRSAPLTHANTHSSRRSLSGVRVRDVHLTILHKDDPIPRMDVVYALSLLETALGGPKNASAALMAISTLGGQSKNREVGALVGMLKEGAERARELRKREKEARRIGRAAAEVVGGTVPGGSGGGGGGGGGLAGAGELPPRTGHAGMELWPAGDLFVLAPALASSGSGGGGGGGGGGGSGTKETSSPSAEGMPKSILKSGATTSKDPAAPAAAAAPAIKAGEMQLFTLTHSQLARSKPTDWGAHRIARYFHILEDMERRLPGLRI